MKYYYSKTLEGTLTEVEARVRKSLDSKGFGVLSEIDIAETFKKKIGENIYPYKILGACNPEMAFKAISAEDKIGLMLPCNVIIQERVAGKLEVSAVDPMASMEAVDNDLLAQTAKEVSQALKEVIESI